MIPFQINSNSREDMHEYLVKYFHLQDYCNALKERFPLIESAEFKRLSTQKASSRIDLFKSLLLDIKKFLSTNVDTSLYFSIGSEIFEAYDDGIDNAFFWDTIIALYLQLIYDKSEQTTMRNFYKSNLEKYGIKYDSYTSYLNDYIYDHPMGEYLNIQKRNLVAPHSIRYIKNCFPIQQYVLIHSYSKSPYSEFTNSNNQNPFKMREFLRSLESADFYNDSAIYCFDKTVQKICDRIYKNIGESDNKKFIYHRDPREQQMEQQLTLYIVEQTYCYEIYAQIASADKIIDSFKRLRSHDRNLYEKISKLIDSEKGAPIFDGLTPPQILSHLPRFNEEVSAYSQKANNFLAMLKSASGIVHVSSVFTRPYIVNYWLYKSGTWNLIQRMNEYGGRVVMQLEKESIIGLLSRTYIPIIQEFYLQTLFWLFLMSDTKIELIRFLKQVLIENLDEWRFSNNTINSLSSTGKKIFSLLFELSRNEHRTIDMIQMERSLLDFNKRMKNRQNAQCGQDDQVDQ